MPPANRPVAGRPRGWVLAASAMGAAAGAAFGLSLRSAVGTWRRCSGRARAVDRTAVPQLHHNCSIERWCSDKASMKLAEIAGRQLSLGAPPAGLEPATRRLEVVGRGSTEVWGGLHTGLGQGVSIGPYRLAQGELRPQLRPRRATQRPEVKRVPSGQEAEKVGEPGPTGAEA